MLDSKQFLLVAGLFSIQSIASTNAQIVAGPYQYNGGVFTVKTAFKFDTNVVTDSVAGSNRLEPILTITNTSTGRSITTSYISENDYITTSTGNVLTGNEVVPGGQNPRTNMGTVIVEASSLGAGPLVFRAAASAELSGLAPQKIRNVFNGAFYLWTIRPQSIMPSLSPYIPPKPKPPGDPVPVPASTNIHAVIISGRSDPAKIVTSQNVTLTGGVVALGKDPAPPVAPSSWTTGFRIVPDEGMLTGTKIPPVTPNIIDVRIVKHEVVGDLPSPGTSPSP